MNEYDWRAFTNLVHQCADLYQMAELNQETDNIMEGFADTMNDAIFEMIAFLVKNGISVDEIERRMVAANIAQDVAHSYTHD